MDYDRKKRGGEGEKERVGSMRNEIEKEQLN